MKKSKPLMTSGSMEMTMKKNAAITLILEFTITEETAHKAEEEAHAVIKNTQ